MQRVVALRLFENLVDLVRKGEGDLVRLQLEAMSRIDLRGLAKELGVDSRRSALDEIKGRIAEKVLL